MCVCVCYLLPPAVYCRHGCRLVSGILLVFFYRKDRWKYRGRKRDLFHEIYTHLLSYTYAVRVKLIWHTIRSWMSGGSKLNFLWPGSGFPSSEGSTHKWKERRDTNCCLPRSKNCSWVNNISGALMVLPSHVKTLDEYIVWFWNSSLVVSDVSTKVCLI